MEIADFIAAQEPERRDLLERLHGVIVAHDSTVVAVVEPMMGKEMIVYKARGQMKYALASGKQHMSLHAMPIYGKPALREKYEALLPDAGFQKGCVNFKGAGEMPMDVVGRMIADCAPVDLAAIKAEYERNKKSGASGASASRPGKKK
jgi:hypothetical protein